MNCVLTWFSCFSVPLGNLNLTDGNSGPRNCECFKSVFSVPVVSIFRPKIPSFFGGIIGLFGGTGGGTPRPRGIGLRTTVATLPGSPL